jgi:hypothetical protein
MTSQPPKQWKTSKPGTDRGGMASSSEALAHPWYAFCDGRHLLIPRTVNNFSSYSALRYRENSKG